MKKTNPSFLGVEGLDKLEYAEMEVHLSNVHTFSSPKPSNYLYSDKQKGLYGFKFEVDEESGKIMLFGFCSYNPITKKNGYHYIYRENEKDMDFTIINMLKSIIKDCHFNNKIICHFDEIESILILKLLMECKKLSQDEQVTTFQRVLKGINGKFHKKSGTWTEPPIIELDIGNGESIGVSKVLNGSLELFVTKGEKINTCHTFRSKPFWQKTPIECARNANLKYVEEIKEQHINWDIFSKGYNREVDKNNHRLQDNTYVKKVLRINMYNSFLAKDLIQVVTKMFKESFDCYPNSFYSAGTLAEAVIDKVLNEKELKGFSIDSTIENWQEKEVDVETIAKAINISFDANQGAIIEHEKVGYISNGANTDISSSYPAVMRYCIPDLKDSTAQCFDNIKDFNEVPKPSLNRVVMLTCEFEIPPNVRHTIMIKQKGDEGTVNQIRRNVLGFGNFIASAHYKEIEFLLSQIEPEKRKEVIKEIIEVVVIETTGKLHPISKVIDILWELRLKLRGEGKHSEYIVKLIMNAIYGKFFQAFQQYACSENEDGEQEIYFAGFDVGYMFNPIVSSMITAFGRIRVQEGALNIEKNGGRVISILTDCVKFETPDSNRPAYDYLDNCFDSILNEFEMLNVNGWSPKGSKVLGIFEEPEEFTEGLFLNTAVYEYKLFNDKWEVKTSGYQTFDKEFENESYLMKKLEHFIDKPESHFFKYGKRAGEYGLKLGKLEIINYFHIVEDLADFRHLGIKRHKELPLIFDSFSLKPKRSYYKHLNEEIELSLETAKDRLFETSPVDISMECGGFNDSFEWETFDNRKKTARELLKISKISELKKVKKENRLQQKRKCDRNKREILSALQKQIKENIDLFSFDKFTMKEGSNGGHNARDYGIEKMRDLLKTKNIEPIA
ncbi:hypothetical protein [Bacillus thuringiensis]|uniref:hypothetical protein n=1 Tax=Bacillus thuringiensis TaxID=1428 RepID=UPI003B985B4F